MQGTKIKDRRLGVAYKESIETIKMSLGSPVRGSLCLYGVDGA